MYMFIIIVIFIQRACDICMKILHTYVTGALYVCHVSSWLEQCVPAVCMLCACALLYSTYKTCVVLNLVTKLSKRNFDICCDLGWSNLGWYITCAYIVYACLRACVSYICIVHVLFSSDLYLLQFQSIDCVFTDEPFMLQSEIHCMSPWQLKIVDSNYRWNSTVSTASQVPDQVKNCKHTSSSSSSSSCFLPPSQSPLPHHFT